MATRLPATCMPAPRRAKLWPLEPRTRPRFAHAHTSSYGQGMDRIRCYSTLVMITAVKDVRRPTHDAPGLVTATFATSREEKVFCSPQKTSRMAPRRRPRTPAETRPPSTYAASCGSQGSCSRTMMVVSCARAALSSSRDARVATPGYDHRHLPVPELEPHPQMGAL